MTPDLRRDPLATAGKDPEGAGGPGGTTGCGLLVASIAWEALLLLLAVATGMTLGRVG
jgi:hypothetical protein